MVDDEDDDDCCCCCCVVLVVIANSRRMSRISVDKETKATAKMNKSRGYSTFVTVSTVVIVGLIVARLSFSILLLLSTSLSTSCGLRCCCCRFIMMMPFISRSIRMITQSPMSNHTHDNKRSFCPGWIGCRHRHCETAPRHTWSSESSCVRNHIGTRRKQRQGNETRCDATRLQGNGSRCWSQPNDCSPPPLSCLLIVVHIPTSIKMPALLHKMNVYSYMCVCVCIND